MTTLAAPTRIAASLSLLLLAAAIVVVWRIGPVVATFTPGHGLHAGDVLALPCAVIGGRLARLPGLRPVFVNR